MEGCDPGFQGEKCIKGTFTNFVFLHMYYKRTFFFLCLGKAYAGKCIITVYILQFVMLGFMAQSVNKNAVNSVTRNKIAILRRVTVGRVVNVAGKVQNVSSVRHICCAFHIWKLCKNDTDTVLFNPLICIFFCLLQLPNLKQNGKLVSQGFWVQC